MAGPIVKGKKSNNGKVTKHFYRFCNIHSTRTTASLYSDTTVSADSKIELNWGSRTAIRQSGPHALLNDRYRPRPSPPVLRDKPFFLKIAVDQHWNSAHSYSTLHTPCRSSTRPVYRSVDFQIMNMSTCIMAHLMIGRVYSLCLRRQFLHQVRSVVRLSSRRPTPETPSGLDCKPLCFQYTTRTRNLAETYSRVDIHVHVIPFSTSIQPAEAQ